MRKEELLNTDIDETKGGQAGGNDGANDGDSGAQDTNRNDTDNGNDEEEDEGSKAKPSSFDDFLKDKKMQAEFDRRLQKALSTAEKRWQAATDEKLSEAEKLAKMTAEQKRTFLADKRERELDAREQKLAQKELKAQAIQTLAEKHMPVELADTLDYSDADSCANSIDVVEKAFTAAVQSAVDDKLKGGRPLKKGDPNKGASDLETQIRNSLHQGTSSGFTIKP